MTDQLDTQAPEGRAETAARDLADRGKPVTARAVREAAGVRMAVAAAAAQAWREATAEQTEVEVPEMPDDVTARMAAVWADAYRAAVATVLPERDRLAAAVDELRAEVEALTAMVSEVEGERDATAENLRDAEADQRATSAELHMTTQANTTYEATITELREHNQTLTGQLEALIARIPANDTDEQK